MSYVDFNPFGIDSVIVRFPCDDCGEQVESEPIFVPEPNYMVEKARETYILGIDASLG